MIIATGGEGVAWVVNNVFIVEVSEDCHEEAAVPVICYTSSVVTLSSQIRDGLKGNLLVLVHKELRNKKRERQYNYSYCFSNIGLKDFNINLVILRLHLLSQGYF